MRHGLQASAAFLSNRRRSSAAEHPRRKEPRRNSSSESAARPGGCWVMCVDQPPHTNCLQQAP
uniref:Uncharacterized protein n=1 Tax=Arundo donax TaxID=35708 RepID=A0A0A9BVH7_ARUDO